MAVKHRYSTLIAFPVKEAIYYVAATVIFSHVKISCFRAKSHLVFHWCLYNKNIYVNSRDETNVRNERMIMHFTWGIQSMKSISVNTNQYQLID